MNFTIADIKKMLSERLNDINSAISGSPSEKQLIYLLGKDAESFKILVQYIETDENISNSNLEESLDELEEKFQEEVYLEENIETENESEEKTPLISTSTQVEANNDTIKHPKKKTFPKKTEALRNGIEKELKSSKDGLTIKDLSQILGFEYTKVLGVARTMIKNKIIYERDEVVDSKNRKVLRLFKSQTKTIEKIKPKITPKNTTEALLKKKNTIGTNSVVQGGNEERTPLFTPMDLK